MLRAWQAAEMKAALADVDVVFDDTYYVSREVFGVVLSVRGRLVW